MTTQNRQASPAVVSGGTQAERIVLTRGELIHILWSYENEVKHPEDFTGFLDRMMGGGNGVGLITFDSGKIPGRRIHG
jgi:hypothetical protein